MSGNAIEIYQYKLQFLNQFSIRDIARKASAASTKSVESNDTAHIKDSIQKSAKNPWVKASSYEEAIGE